MKRNTYAIEFDAKTLRPRLVTRHNNVVMDVVTMDDNDFIVFGRNFDIPPSVLNSFTDSHFRWSGRIPATKP